MIGGSSDKNITCETAAMSEQGVNTGKEGSTQKELEAWSTFETAKILLNADNEDDLEDCLDMFSLALESLVEIHGQMGHALGKVYLWYGRALLKMGIIKQENLFSESVPTALPTTEAATKSVEEGMEGEEECNNEASSKRKKLISFQEDECKDESGDEGDGKTASIDDAAKEEEAEEQQEDDLQLAWEILDIARIIYSDSKKDRADLAVIHVELGDVSMEIENFTQAATDYAKAIDLYKEINSSELERSLASTLFKYSISLEYNGRAAESMNPLRDAHKLVSARIQRLKGLGDDVNGKESQKDGDEEELRELTDLIPEIQNKLDEVEADLKKAKTATIQETMKRAAVNAATDLSNLIKKKE